MDDAQKKKKPVVVGSKVYPAEPSLLEQLSEGFETNDTRAQLEAVRKRRQKTSG